MNQVFDPLNLILLAVALIVFWRLRSVLGTRTGTERPPIDPYARNKTPAGTGEGNVLRFPNDTPKPANDAGEPQEPTKPAWEGFAVEGSPAATGLAKIAEADHSFSARSFVEGAKIAYEMIVEAFAKGDKAELKNLVSREVYDGFASEIDQRGKNGLKLDTKFVGFEKAEVAAAEMQGKRASVTMRFVSQLISATLDNSGAVVEGDPKEIREVVDVWTFERDVNSRDPNWKLVATETPA
jgi:predicted lipid-binding transport protein (Tim44 family)